MPGLSPQQKVREIILHGQVGSTVCGKLSYVKEVMRLMREQIPKEYRFEVEAAEQYRDDFATFDAICRFLLNGRNEQKKHLILTIRAWHGYRDYFDHLIMIALRNDFQVSLNISLVFVFPPDFKNGRELEQSDRLAYKIHFDSSVKLRLYQRLVLISGRREYLDEFSRRFMTDYKGSAQQSEDRALGRPPPGSYLCPEQEAKKRSGQLHPNAYAI